MKAKMNTIKLAVLLTGLILTPIISASINHKSVNNPARSDEVKARDEGRKPAQILNFYGIKPGMTVLDYAASSGYYTEIFSYAVGEKGKVYAQNRPTSGSNESLKMLAAKLPNTEAVLVAGTELDLPENSVDAAFITLIFHHMHFDKSSPDALPANTIKTLANIRKSLKPGGVLAIIEHAALDGTSRADSAALHRIDEATTIADITAQGFTLAGTSKVLHYKNDDRSKNFRQGGKRDTSWRLVHKYTKN
jgi:predicted methyltransferase